ncbi:MAG: Gfo/Idh/MocA family oxidoreductase [Planctomycetaceae bacterium]|jgi:predicted dehydrogenase|nr:Gfo/Idh/MocA family oxidoreductase [Planctomycetaceae bacterium]
MKKDSVTRRGFLKTAAVLGTAAGAGLSLARSVHAQGSGVIKIGLIGCGGRGLGAASQAMRSGKDVKLVAVGDYFKERAKNGAAALKDQNPDQVEVPEDRIFDGFQNDLGVTGSEADVILIACAAKFHPYYAKHAVEAGKHVFVEKPHAVDSAGIHTLEEAVKIAREKGLSFLSGLQSRYCPQSRALVEQIHSGAIGEVRAVQSAFLRAPYGVRGYPAGMPELDVQVYNQYMFRWLSGDDFTQSLVHNVDRMTWALHGELPVQAVGMGGRASMTKREFGDVFDHHSAIYHYKGDHCRLFAVCRTETGCYDLYDDLILGSKGTAYWNEAKIVGETNWKYEGRHLSGHLEEQLDFYAKLRKGERVDSGDYMVNSTLMAILGQVACYTGRMITWQELYGSKFVFKPAPEECTAGMNPPVIPGENGLYPVPVPGQHAWW